jgi:DNA gyrase subunit B
VPTKPKTYDAKSIDIVQNIKHVRMRPLMYITDTQDQGAFQIVKELIDNSVDEWLAGHVKRIRIEVDAQRFVVEDDGRGIPTGKHPETGEPALTSIFTILGSGGKFRKDAYSFSSGLHGVGLTVVNALTSGLTVYTKRGTAKGRSQNFSQGIKKSALRTGAYGGEFRRGTCVEGYLDPEIFGDTDIPLDKVHHTAVMTAVLCPGLKVLMNDEEFVYKGGLPRLLEANARVAVGPVKVKTDQVDVVFGWDFDKEGEEWSSFCNVTQTPHDGLHVSGAQKAISKALMTLSKGSGLSSKELLDGLCGAVHVLVAEPQFQGQSKVFLANVTVYEQVYVAVLEATMKWIRRNKKDAKSIIDRAVEIKKQRAEYKKARATLKKITTKKRGNLPPKLASSPRCKSTRRELYIVEGDSAGGSAISARDPKFQEILPLRGKMPNAQQNSLKKVLDNTEFQSILQSVGGGFGPDFLLKDMRVGKVLLLMDADADGAHLVCLLLAFFIKYLRPVIDEGRLYIVDSPLFVAEQGINRWFGATRAEAEAAAPNGKPVVITRLKGHGSSTVQDLKTYAMGGDRKLIQVTLDRAERALELMDKDAGVRRELLGLA